jgi:hypothetical protein
MQETAKQNKTKKKKKTQTLLSISELKFIA